MTREYVLRVVSNMVPSRPQNGGRDKRIRPFERCSRRNAKRPFVNDPGTAVVVEMEEKGGDENGRQRAVRLAPLNEDAAKRAQFPVRRPNCSGVAFTMARPIRICLRRTAYNRAQNHNSARIRSSSGLFSGMYVTKSMVWGTNETTVEVESSHTGSSGRDATTMRGTNANIHLKRKE